MDTMKQALACLEHCRNSGIKYFRPEELTIGWTDYGNLRDSNCTEPQDARVPLQFAIVYPGRRPTGRGEEHLCHMVGDFLSGWRRAKSPTDTHTPRLEVIDAMERFGGGFVAALAVAWRKGDAENQTRLYGAFSHIYDQYEADFVDRLKPEADPADETGGDLCSRCGNPCDHDEPHTECEACRCG